MIYYAKDRQGELRHEMRGGKGDVKVSMLEKEYLPAAGKLLAELTLQPGCSIGEHEHVGEAEMFYIVEGQATVTDNGTVYVLGPGDGMTTPSGHRHSLENAGSETLKVIAVIIKEIEA